MYETCIISRFLMRDNKHLSDCGDKVSEKYNYVDLQHCFNTVLFDNDNCFIYFNSEIEKE